MSIRYGFAAGLMAAAALGAMMPMAASAQTPRPTVADAQTGKIVAAANAFIATLTPEQKGRAMFAYNDAAQRVLWSNLPTGIVERKGIKRGELDDTQKRALDALLATVLSPVGMKMVREQMEADEVLKNTPGSANGPGRGPNGPPGTPRPPGAPGGPGAGGPPPGGAPGGARPPGGGPGGRAPLQFGQDLYFVSFLGTPSTTAPWELQFGGHHLAINATVVGGGMTLAPSLTGGQPVKYDKDGKEIYIVEDEVKKAQALIDSLSPAQRAKAVLAPQSIDLILGPGHDGQTLQPEGLQAMEMSAAQKTQLLALIEARLGIMNADDLAAAMAKIRLNLNQTTFAWYGPTDSAGGAYFRVTGPTLVLEFSPQDTRTGGVSNHLHNMYRDPTNDYGAAWASLK